MSVSYPDLSLYVITDKKLSQGRPHLEVAEKAIAGGATCIQLRDKEDSAWDLFCVAEKLRELTQKNGVTFIINDRLDVALAVEADGVHLGVDDLPLSAAKRIMPHGMLLGASPATPQEVREAEKAGASYLGVGPIYFTSTKPDAGDPIGTAELAEICRSVEIPVVGIGGINSTNAGEVIRAGAAGAAVISCVVGAEDISGAARRIKSEIEAARASLQGGGPEG